MLLGACIDAGVDVAMLQRYLRKLPLPSWRLEVERVRRAGMSALHVHVDVPPESAHRRLPDIRRIILAADLPPAIVVDSLRVFERLAQAEAVVHRVPPDRVHFHEVGAVDAIIDIVGVVLGLRSLGIRQLFYDAFPAGHGTIRCEHGVVPNPAPATVLLTRGHPIRHLDTRSELVTPTGAALLTTLGTPATHWPGRHPEWTVGVGAGTRDEPRWPNVSRLAIAPADAAVGPRSEIVCTCCMCTVAKLILRGRAATAD